MRAVILCAGRGTRLGSLTMDCPKPMLPINSIPLLGHIVRNMVAASVTEIGINLHYLPESIREYLGDGSRWRIAVHYFYEKQLLGTAGALVPMFDWLQEDDEFLVSYGDIVTDQDLRLLLEAHRKRNSFATLLVHSRQVSNSVVTMDGDGRIRSFLERPVGQPDRSIDATSDTGQNWVNSGVQILSRRALHYIKDKGCRDLPKDVYEVLVEQEAFFGVVLTGRRVAIDSPERYQEACRLFQ